jgi:hypothetical protein
MTDKDPIELLADRSLFQIWWRLNVTGREGVKDSKAIALLLVVAVTLNFAYLICYAETDALPEQIRYMALHGLKLATGVLSFLLAGFVFLLSASNADLLYAMYKHEHEGTRLDYLRYNTFSLLALFSEFFAASLLFGIIVVFGQPLGLLPNLLGLVPDSFRDIVLRAGYFVLSTTFLWLIFRLKSYITTIYHFAMTGLVYKFDEMRDAEQREAHVEPQNLSTGTTCPQQSDNKDSGK